MANFTITQQARGQGTVFEISNQQGLSIGLSTLGAALRSCRWQGREITLGYADEATYGQSNPYFAVSVGRFANRIAGGHCTVAGKTLTLATNNAPNHLHGGVDGFDKRQWQAKVIEGALRTGDRGSQPAAGVRFTLTSPDGDQGYPGTLEAAVTILITADSQLAFAYQASTSALTPINLTNHTYWNLQGEGSGGIHDHQLRLHCPAWLDVDAGSIPTGKALATAGSPWDFSQPRLLSTVISPKTALRHAAFTRGIDHNFIVDPRQATVACDLDAAGSSQKSALRLCAELSAPGSATMQVLTSLPGVQVYTANYLDGQAGRQGPLQTHAGLCLETQDFPDCPNQAPAFRQIGAELGYAEAEMAGWDGLLAPGKTWEALTVHRFK